MTSFVFLYYILYWLQTSKVEISFLQEKIIQFSQSHHIEGELRQASNFISQAQLINSTGLGGVVVQALDFAIPSLENATSFSEYTTR